MRPASTGMCFADPALITAADVHSAFTGSGGGSCGELDLFAEVIEAMLGALVNLDSSARGILGAQELHRAAALRTVDGHGCMRHGGWNQSR
jgi:hypothetical protein